MAERFAISAGTVVPINRPPIDNAAVIVNGRQIEAIVPREIIPPDIRIEKFPDAILLPAFVNAHCHLVYSAYRGIADDKPFFEWLTDHIIPLDVINFEDDCRKSAALGVELSFRNGITAICESHYLPWGRLAMSDSGMKGVFFYEVFGVISPDLPASVIKHREIIEKYAVELQGDIRFGVSPHAPYSVPPSMAQMVKEVCEKYQLPLSIHVAETRDEELFFQSNEGKFANPGRIERFPRPDPNRTPLIYLDENGLLSTRTLLIHGIYLSDSDLEIIHDRGCTLVTCPTSNAKLASGIARADIWKRKNIPICIATDSLASCDSFDLFEEMRGFALFQRASTGVVDSFSANEILNMVTINPARALGIEDMVGDLREGSHADLIIVEPDKKDVSSNRDVYGTILWGTSSKDIVKVFSDGNEVYNR
ncbi:MAG: amidohydrolase family protein [bacterium]